jgi:hypothetical protein
MTRRRFFLGLTLAAVGVFLPAAPRAQSGDESTVAQQSQSGGKKAGRLEGSWEITVSAVVPPGVPPPPVRTAYVSFARGGVAILSERQAAFVNPAYGSWKHVGGNEFAFTVIADAFNPTGIFLGTVKIRNRLTLTGPDEFVSVGNLEVRDPAGNPLFSGCATGKGERIKVEPLAEQCQGITPPQ